ncbi:MAG TPA: hypothetical protein VFQ52_01640 [Rhizomicrobium sp.]|nr:hypothetical protein [Rhizomicrobium sp.]
MTGKKKATRPGLHPLHEAAMRIADLGMKTSRGKTKDLVGMLLTHGARAWRTTQPEARIHLYIRASSKGAPVRLRLR